MMEKPRFTFAAKFNFLRLLRWPPHQDRLTFYFTRIVNYPGKKTFLKAALVKSDQDSDGNENRAAIKIALYWLVQNLENPAYIFSIWKINWKIQLIFQILKIGIIRSEKMLSLLSWYS